MPLEPQENWLLPSDGGREQKEREMERDVDKQGLAFVWLLFGASGDPAV